MHKERCKWLLALENLSVCVTVPKTLDLDLENYMIWFIHENHS